MLAMWAVFFWRTPNCDDDIIKLLEETSLIIVLRRNLAAEQAEKVSRFSLTFPTDRFPVIHSRT